MNANTKIQLVEALLKREGWDKVVNDPKDSGGLTKWGVTQSSLNVARRRIAGLPASVRDLTQSQAVSIYILIYLEWPKFDKVYDVDAVVGTLVFDFGVLAGQQPSARILQRALNVLNNEQSRWPDLVVDGLLGPRTLHALELARVAGYIKDVAYSVAVLQTNYLLELAERRPKDERFIVGWQRNRAIGLLGKLMNGL